jgi:hypothetical protein
VLLNCVGCAPPGVAPGAATSLPRSFNFRHQQQQAIKLNKQHPSELYQWWIVDSLALQAHAAATASHFSAMKQAAAEAAAAEQHSGSSSSSSKARGSGTAASSRAADAGLGVSQLLQLAEGMAARLLAKSDKHNSWDAVMLYLGLLQAQV